ncbi:MAG: hypothetical protein Q9173_003729, partial [Seirophora scorigena]
GKETPVGADGVDVFWFRCWSTEFREIGSVTRMLSLLRCAPLELGNTVGVRLRASHGSLAHSVGGFGVSVERFGDCLGNTVGVLRQLATRSTKHVVGAVVKLKGAVDWKRGLESSVD